MAVMERSVKCAETTMTTTMQQGKLFARSTAHRWAVVIC